MPAEHLKEEEEFDEDTLFDQAGLLTNQIKPRADVRNVNGTMRITPMKTFALCLAFFGLGLSFAILEPTLLDLQQLAGTDVQKISYTITARALGYILGSALGILLFDRYNRQFLLFLSMLSMMVLLGVLPWCHNLVAYIFLLFLLGVLMQMLYAGGNVLCLDLWGKQSGPFLQAIHFSLALGVFLAPLLCNAIMMGNTGVSMAERPVLINFNSSQALALPASSLFGVRISSSGVYSRHRRAAADDTDAIPLNLTETSTEAANESPTTGNKPAETTSAATSVIPTMSNSTNVSTNSSLPIANTTANSTVSTSTPETRTDKLPGSTTPESQVNTTMPSANVTDATFNATLMVKPSHKPKPSITDAKHLKKAPDPWDRDPPPDKKVPVPPVPPPPVPTSTVQPTTVVQLPTNGSSDSVNAAIANSTDALSKPVSGSSLVVNSSSSVAVTTPVSSNSTNSAVALNFSENTVPTPTILNLNSSATGQVANLSQQLGEEKINSSKTSAVSDRLSVAQIATTTLMTSTVPTTTSTEAATVGLVTSFEQAHPVSSVDTNSETEASDINTTQESETHLRVPNNESLEMHSFTKPDLSTKLPINDHSAVQEELYSSISQTSPTNLNTVLALTPTPAIEGDVVNGDSTSISDTKLSTGNSAAVTDGVVSPSLVASPQGSTESNVIISEHASTLLPNYSGNNGAATADSSEEGPNVTVHHKPSTFNNQSEDSPQLLNDLLNRISEMGVTKVHIVYVVMSVIVLLTSLVFLSFLCHNPRELRSKQEEGVKPGMQEGKFTSIMVGLMFVMIIFYTSAELVFSQLYLSLVWQSSAHLLRSRGSLLISVFWGLYAFSRGTSICCTNGFRPATMLLVDLVCCIISAGTLSIFGSGVESVLWCSVAVMAIGLSSILPYSLLWLEEYIHISNKTACVLLMGGSVVNLVLSFMYGHPVTVSRSLVIYLVLTCCVFALLIFGIMWRLATWRGDKYGLNCKMDVRYQLASQVDEEEDSFELSSGNSSLYLLNNGNNQNGHTSWDSRTEPTLAYLPLKQKKTKWK